MTTKIQFGHQARPSLTFTMNDAIGSCWLLSVYAER
jgi:hypothetical protein